MVIINGNVKTGSTPVEITNLTIGTSVVDKNHRIREIVDINEVVLDEYARFVKSKVAVGMNAIVFTCFGAKSISEILQGKNEATVSLVSDIGTFKKDVLQLVNDVIVGRDIVLKSSDSIVVNGICVSEDSND